ncbi:hypothetical protein HXX76_008491 [Chlamydomonas incerta]|uniref:AB hydrolase-1 domain-containing protein n=1 Tax=Chlamydomonas incerta TaxID=51695 RepID=A0A835SUH5_CHLIN|nr:hypothetical protein HXX76_008491 [Chlamydomonas incerta]|eukprot:KAG2433434.1 hypothetical protein HXX76_008491 [Chlamydomonas incerta]
MGHSLGGSMAALLEFERPGTFRSMFLFEPVLRPHQVMPPRPPAPQAPQQQPQQPLQQSAAPTARGSAEAPAAAGRPNSGASSSASGCGPSPSLVRPQAEATQPGSAQQQQQQQQQRPQSGGVVEAAGGSGAAGGGPGAAAAPPPVTSPLAHLARKRQAHFPSVEAAVAALGAKPPFIAFHPLALHAYLACGGLRPAVQPAGPGAAAAAGSGSSGGGGVTLACAPESEARVFEALALPPWRPWSEMGAARCGGSGSSAGCGSSGCGSPGCGSTGCGGCAAGSSREPAQAAAGKAGHAGACGTGCCCRGSGDGGGACCSGSSSGGGGWCGRCCRVAIAVGRTAGGLHAALPVFGAGVAAQVPGAQLIRFPALGHLGPMEDPAAVADVALGFWLGGGGGGGGGGDVPAPASRL